MLEILGFSVFLAIGAFLLYRGVLELVLALSSRNWPTTYGIVLVADLQRSRDSDGGMMYGSEVAYSYKVEGVDFIGSRARFGDQIKLSWSKPAVKIVQRYKVGTEVVVKFDPNDPKESALETGVTGLVWASLAFGGAFTAMGVLGLVSRL